VPFVGLGVGTVGGFLVSADQWYEVFGDTGEPEGYTDERFSYVLCPRIGVEVCNRIRFTVDNKMTNQIANHICANLSLSLGIVFGGGVPPLRNHFQSNN